MAKGVATCKCATCNKIFKVEATKYNRAEADSWVSYAERTYDECTECYKARKEAERAAANAEAAERAKEQGLPALTGSPKQIAWAEKLRMTLLDQLEATAAKDEHPEEWRLFSAWLVAKYTSASYWIDHRSDGEYVYMLREVPIYNTEREGAKDAV